MFSENQKIGLFGERIAYQELTRRGFQVELRNSFNAKNTDMRVNGIPAEVKFANPTRRYSQGRVYTRWQWRVSRTAGDMLQDWILILIAKDSRYNTFYYIMPGDIIGYRDHLQLTSHPDVYRGWLSPWRNRWDIIDYLKRQIYLDNGPLFDQWAGGQYGSV